LGLEDLGAGREALVERVVRGEVPEGARQSLEDLRREVAAGFERLVDGAGGFDPTVGGALAASRNRVLAEIARAEWKVLRSLKRRDLASVRQLERVLGSLRPDGKPQDRVLNVLSFLGRYGPHFLREVERSIGECWRLPVRG
jgi:bacillithiol synthase